MLVCDEPDPDPLIACQPSLNVEILLAATQENDQALKLAAYLRLPALTTHSWSPSIRSE